MSAGLPGLGLGGLFFILSALIAPLSELLRTLRGESSVARWLQVWRQFALAVAMIVAVDLTLRGAYLGISLSGLGDPPGRGPVTVLPLVPIAITAGLLAAVLALAKSLELGARLRSGGLPPVSVPVALPSGPRLLSAGGALAAIWFALLFVGASELSPLSSGDADDTRSPAVAEHSPGPGEGGIEDGSDLDGARLLAGEPSGSPAASHTEERALSRTPAPATGAERDANTKGEPDASEGASQPGQPDSSGSSPSAEVAPLPPAAEPVPSAEQEPPADAGPAPDAGPPADAGSTTGGGPSSDAGPSPSAGPPLHAGAESTGPPEQAKALGWTD